MIFRCLKCGKPLENKSIINRDDMYCDRCKSKGKTIECPLCLGKGFIVEEKEEDEK